MNYSASLVSVVMPSFNQSRFIEAAVRSVLEQKYPPLELVIADGGSTDGTLQCLEGLVGIFGDKLRWVSEQDSGPANAINKALGLARGNIIGWLNSDDLYAPRAISKAFLYLSTNPDAVMVYGEGEHVDETGKQLGRYPTLPPSVSTQAFQDGCFICQPTVFLRREVFDVVGLLDESLATAFDFELWLRVFRKFPGRIACLDQVLAYSRIHADCITSRERRLVATDNIKILGKYFGHAKPHWLLTYVEELYKSYPFGVEPSDLKTHVQTVLSEVETFLSECDAAQFKDVLARDARFKLALPDVYASVYTDGWAPQCLEIRIRGAGHKVVLLHCDNRRPDLRPIRLQVSGSWGAGFSMVVDKPGYFEIAVPIPDSYAHTNSTITISSDDVFVPKHFDAISTDTRQLVFKLSDIELPLE
jgi:glycosyltransferase involved in cell wall biosynthesis